MLNVFILDFIINHSLLWLRKTFAVTLSMNCLINDHFFILNLNVLQNGFLESSLQQSIISSCYLYIPIPMFNISTINLCTWKGNRWHSCDGRGRCQTAANAKRLATIWQVKLAANKSVWSVAVAKAKHTTPQFLIQLYF